MSEQKKEIEKNCACTTVYATDLSGSCSSGKYSADTGLLFIFQLKMAYCMDI